MTDPAIDRPRTVVLVDDCPDVRAVVSAVLQAEGYRVLAEAGSIAEAPAVVAAADPDAVIVDHQLGDGLGVSVIPELKRGGDRVVVLLTGVMSLALQADAIAAGADAALDKRSLLHVGSIVGELLAAQEPAPSII